MAAERLIAMSTRPHNLITHATGRSTECADFLAAVWPEIPDGAWLGFWGIPSKKSEWTQVIDAALTERLTAWGQKENVYVMVGLRRANLGPNLRGERQDVVAIPGIFLDVDYGQEHRKQNLPPTEADAVALIDAMGPAPSIIVHSGRGLQAWWLFREPWILANDEDRDAAEKLTKGWCSTLRARAHEKGWDADQVGDLPRVMRLPGLWNRKGVPKQTRLLSCEDLRYESSDLESYLIQEAIRKTETAKLNWDIVKRADAEPPSQKVLLLSENDTDFKRLCLRIPREGQKDTSASGYDYQLARIAFAAKWTGQEVVNLLIAQRRAHRCDLKLSHPTYYESTLSSALSDRDEETRQKLVEAANGDQWIATGQPGHIDPEPGFTKKMADTILLTDHFACDAGGALYVFENGVYAPHGEEWIARRVKALLETRNATKQWSSHRVREIIEFIRVDRPRLWERPPLDALNLTNGLLDLPTRTLKPHTPEHLSAVQLPVAYDPAAACPEWDRFVSRVFTQETRTLAYEIPAYLMRPDVTLRKAILCIGKGRNGKSTYLKAVTAFLGRCNVAGLSLQKLEVDKFAVVRLLGKLANICPDLPSDHLTSTSIFKSLTGDDRMNAERKFQNSFEFEPFARLVFSANHYPQSKDSSEAFFERWLIIPFETTITNAEAGQVPDLAARLAHPRELSGVLNRALDALNTITARHGFTQSEATSAAGMEFREMTDPLSAWLDRHTVLAPEGMVTKKDLLIAYNGAAESAGRPALSSKAFYASVKQLRPSIKEAQRRVHGDVQWVFLGLGLSQVSRHSQHSSEISLES